MAKPVSHQLDIYGAWLHVCTDRRAWATLRRRIDSIPRLDPDELGATSRDIDDEGGVHLSLFLDMDRLAGNHMGLTEILAHEACHAGAMLLDHIGQDYDGESEALAYLVGFIAAYAWGVCE